MGLTPRGAEPSGAPRRKSLRGTATSVVIVLLGISPVAAGAPEASSPAVESEQNPDDVPFMRPPYGQALPEGHRWEPTLSGEASPTDRVRLNLMPLYAALHLDFIGRSRGATVHGGGAGLEGDLRLWRGLFLRLATVYTAHPLRAAYADPEEEGDAPTQIAEAGTLHATGGSIGALYALDFGRFFPFVEGGAGLLWLLAPDGVRSGQRGQPCLTDGRCDPGLVCSTANECTVAPLPELHAGVGMDWLLTDRWSLGAVVRYYALFSDPGTFPIYLLAGARLGARF